MFLLGQEANAAQTCIETVAASEVDRQFATYVVNSYARDLSYGLRMASIKGMENSIYSSPFVGLTVMEVVKSSCINLYLYLYVVICLFPMEMSY